MGYAAVLSEALSITTPEQLNDSVISEFYQKCIDSQEIISTQIHWASVSAERSRTAEEERERTDTNNAGPSDWSAPSSTYTFEEALLADLLTANEQLTEVLRLYDDLERVAFEREAEERSRGEGHMDSRSSLRTNLSMRRPRPPSYTAIAVTTYRGLSSPTSPRSAPTSNNPWPHNANRESEVSAHTPLTPAQRYVGWVAEAVAPLQEFIDEPVDPREFYCGFQEIAQGQNGSVFAATLVPDAPIHRLRLPPLLKERDAEDVAKGRNVLVAVKRIALLPGENSRLLNLRRECELLRGLSCEQVLGMDALYVDFVADELWIRMELMERTLADMIWLVHEGLRLREARVMARVASDMLHALDYLQEHSIAHRNLCSDNVLLNRDGVLKLTGFSDAIRVTPETPLATDVVGIVYWQAPEVRSGAYEPA
ncbi:Kinase-like protein [Mycena venus]|uniref:Kinase-like protein n=1 Tax=Mycena venus TaxID=2733690 RepID=A0A8H6XQ67_9AGAR|nr:Kinase-like protein [Mycena venus]